MQFPLLAVEDNVKADTPFTLLVADSPFMLDYAPSATHWKCRVRTIGEWPAMKNASLTMHKETGLVDLSREEAAAYLPHYFNLCRSLSAYAEAHACRAAAGEAIALRLEEGALATQLLSGDARPPLLGVTLNGEYVAAQANWALVDVQREDVEVLEAHAETGDLTSIQALIALYTYGSAEVAKDATALLHWQGMLAERGDKQAAQALALQYAHGYGVARDYTKAAEWMKKTGEAEKAQDFLQNAEEAARAEAGDAHAQAQLASTLLLQAGKLDSATLEEDYREAVNWADKAATAEDALGVWILAQAYENGLGVNADLEQALDYYKKGAQLGNADCQVSLAEHLLHGDVCMPNEAKAFNLARQAAQADNLHAMRLIADCYMKGSGTQQDKTQALYWYQKVAEQIQDPAVEEAIEYLTR